MTRLSGVRPKALICQGSLRQIQAPYLDLQAGLGVACQCAAGVERLPLHRSLRVFTNRRRIIRVGSRKRIPPHWVWLAQYAALLRPTRLSSTRVTVASSRRPERIIRRTMPIEIATVRARQTACRANHQICV